MTAGRSLRLSGIVLGVRLAFRVGAAPFLLAGPTLMSALGLDFLPDHRW
jgi:hypothetical protein